MKIKKVIKDYVLKEVLEHLSELEAELIAGGTDLMVKIREEKNEKEVLIDISDVKELKNIEILDDFIRIGSCVKFTDIVENDYIKENYFGLYKAVKSVGSPQIRNLGTIGGNIANGSPAADSVPPLLVLNARVILESKNGKRVKMLKDLYIDKGNVDIKDDEILTYIEFDKIVGKIGFEKLGLRNALAISRISTSVYIELMDEKINTIRVASGSLGLYPIREFSLEEFMIGNTLTDEFINKSAEKYCEIIDERLKGRSTLEFKREAIKGMFVKCIKDLIS